MLALSLELISNYLLILSFLYLRHQLTGATTN